MDRRLRKFYRLISHCFGQWPLTVLGIILFLWLRCLIWFVQVSVSTCCFPCVFFYRKYRRRPPIILRTPEDQFKRCLEAGYTFESHYFDFNYDEKVDDRVLSAASPIDSVRLRVHYIDEGPKDAKETILCLHGEASWSFAYRNVIHVIRDASRLSNNDTIRVIALDFVGFGKSDKLTDDFMYSLKLHKATIHALLDKLELSNVTVVAHHWGGPIILALLKDLPSNVVSRLVLMNTALVGAPRAYHYAPIQAALNTLLWLSTAYVFGQYLHVGFIFDLACRNLSHVARECYVAPFPDRNHVAGVAMFPRLFPVPLPFFQKNLKIVEEMKGVATYLSEWQKPTLLLFSSRCPLSNGSEKYFKILIPGASPYTPIIIKGAGHFLQEEKPQEVGNNIYQFVRATGNSPGGIKRTVTTKCLTPKKGSPLRLPPTYQKRSSPPLPLSPNFSSREDESSSIVSPNRSSPKFHFNSPINGDNNNNKNYSPPDSKKNIFFPKYNGDGDTHMRDVTITGNKRISPPRSTLAIPPTVTTITPSKAITDTTTITSTTTTTPPSSIMIPSRTLTNIYSEDEVGNPISPPLVSIFGWNSKSKQLKPLQVEEVEEVEENVTRTTISSLSTKIDSGVKSNSLLTNGELEKENKIPVSKTNGFHYSHTNGHSSPENHQEQNTNNSDHQKFPSNSSGSSSKQKTSLKDNQEEEHYMNGHHPTGNGISSKNNSGIINHDHHNGINGYYNDTRRDKNLSIDDVR